MSSTCLSCDQAVNIIDLSLLSNVEQTEPHILLALLTTKVKDEGRVRQPLVLCSVCLASVTRLHALQREMDAINAKIAAEVELRRNEEAPKSNCDFKSYMHENGRGSSLPNHPESLDKATVEDSIKLCTCSNCEDQNFSTNAMTPYGGRFVCPVCNAYFLKAEIFLAHTHLDPLNDPEKVVYICTLCDGSYEYASPSSLRQHQQYAHVVQRKGIS